MSTLPLDEYLVDRIPAAVREMRQPVETRTARGNCKEEGGVKLFPADKADLAAVWAGALCAQVDPELFFPEKGAQEARLAKQICASCEVRELCLATFGPFMREGIVGGTSPKERRGMRRAARKAAA